MDRRAAGVLVLGLALLAAWVVPNLATKQVGGRAVAAVVQGPPVVGECLARPANVDAGASLTLAVLSYGSCGGVHFGEVVKVIAEGAADLSAGWLDNTVSDICESASNRYLGIDQAQATVTEETDTWFPVVHTGEIAGIPDRRQAAAGQRWLACTLTPVPTSGSAGYAGLSRNAMSAGPVSGRFGVCGDQTVISGGAPTACDEPHLLQIVGSAATNNASSVAGLLASCQKLLTALTKMPDLTAAGRLKVVVTYVAWIRDDLVATSSSPQATDKPQSATCALQTVGAVRLTGSLLGLAGAPAPLAG